MYATTSQLETKTDLIAAIKFQEMKNPGKAYIRKMGEHLGRDIQEHLTLFVRENADTDKQIERNGILTIRPHAKATILICHGFMCNKFDTGFLRFLFKDYHVLTFDFRAHGEKAEDQCCTFGKEEMNEVIAAAQYIRKHKELKSLPLLVYGFSMGAVASILAQAQQPGLFDAMILDCPFDSTDNIIQRGIEKLKISVWGYEIGLPGSSFLKEYAYTPYVQSLLKYFFKAVAKMDSTQVNSHMQPISTIDYIKKISVPIFIIGCVNDEKVPPQALIKMYTNAPAPIKKLWITDGARHYDSFFYNPEGYSFQVNDFIKKFIRGNFPKKRSQTLIFDKPEWEKEFVQSSLSQV
jgi:pimeloyl-ACP methyl ester carboxylesterase